MWLHKRYMAIISIGSVYRTCMCTEHVYKTCTEHVYVQNVCTEHMYRTCMLQNIV